MAKRRRNLLLERNASFLKDIFSLNDSVCKKASVTSPERVVIVSTCTGSSEVEVLTLILGEVSCDLSDRLVLIPHRVEVLNIRGDKCLQKNFATFKFSLNLLVIQPFTEAFRGPARTSMDFKVSCYTD